jgi:bifunctional DNA-binding transcriptional regulator/antitoxin component of YhaV-PrlF toxin-antitoxin module
VVVLATLLLWARATSKPRGRSNSGTILINVGQGIAVKMPKLRVDSKHRVVLETGLRRTAGIESGDELTAIAFHGGIILTSSDGETFAESLRGFGFKEGEHEATRYILKGRGAETREDANP